MENENIFESDPILEDLKFLARNKDIEIDITYNDSINNVQGFLKSYNTEFARFIIPCPEGKVRNITIRVECIDIIEFEKDFVM